MSMEEVVILIFLILQRCYSQDSSSNSVEVITPYQDRRCTRPEGLSDADMEATPDTNEISLYETYTITCKTESIFVDADSLALLSNTKISLTCIPEDGNGALLSPDRSSWPSCVSVNNYKQDVQEFITQIGTTPSNYELNGEVPETILGCWTETGENEYGATNCWDRYDKSASLDIGCTNEQVLLGYNTLSIVETEEKIWGKDIIDDTELKLSPSCVASSEAMCKDVDTVPATSTSKLSVIQNKRDDSDRDPDLKMNIAEVTDSELASVVTYRFQCDEGYSFEDGIDPDTVYGYCIKAGGDDPTGNKFFVFSADNKEMSISCSSTCPSNPTVSQFVQSSDLKFEKLFLPSMKKGETFQLKSEGVKCDNGESLDPAGPQTFSIECQGATVDVQGNNGKLHCSECPKCSATCTAEPTPDDIINGAENGLQSIAITMPHVVQSVAQVTKTGVTCEDGKKISATVGDEYVYDFNCLEQDDQGVKSYMYSCGDNCPVCYNVCADKFTLSDKNIDEVQLGSTSVPESVITIGAGAITCGNGYALPAAHMSKEFTVWCGNDGQYSCSQAGETIECPECKGKCPATASFAESNVKTITMTDDSAPESVITVSASAVTCDDGFALPASDSIKSFKLWCGNDGAYSCEEAGHDIECPVCERKCPETVSFSERKVDLVTLGAPTLPQSIATVSASAVTCLEDHMISYIDKTTTFKLWCGNDGVYACDSPSGETVVCPECHAACEWPADSDEIAYKYSDSSANGDKMMAGINHVEATCKDSTTALLGPRYMSCEDGEAAFVGYDSSATPACEAGVSLCAAPMDGTESIINGGKTGNIKVGDSFTINCAIDMMFDLDTRTEGGSEDEFVVECAPSEALVPTESAPIEAPASSINIDLKAVSCYKGCDAVSAFSGEVNPGPVTSGAAPYELGQTITFVCPRGTEVDDSGGRHMERTCTAYGLWNVPICTTPEESSVNRSVISGIICVLNLWLLLL